MPGDHGRVPMAGQDGSGDGVKSADEGAGHVGVPEGVEAVFHAELFPNPLEPAVDRRTAPLDAVGIPKHRAGGILHHHALGDGKGLVGQINDPLEFFALALPDRKHPSA